MPDSSMPPLRTSPPAHGGGHGHTPPTFTPEPDVHILDRLAVLYRYRRVVVAVFVLTTAAMMIQGYTSLQLYSAQAQIMVEDERATAVPGLNKPENLLHQSPDP